ncbi:MAG: EAL domain-containing protein [Chloroflexota bacterium]|nr:EAL domain-containing protein [Chloroflexota bacterium]
MLAMAVAAVCLMEAWVVFGGARSNTENAVTSFAAPLIDLVAAVLVARAARSATGLRTRVAWALIALGMLVYAAGDGIWAWVSIVQHADPFPSAADVAYVAFYPIVAGGLLLFPAPSRAKREAIRLAIDSAIVVVGGGMVIWQSLLLPALAAAEPDPITTGLVLGYPIGDLVLLFAVATIALRRPGGIAPRALVALVAGLGLMFVADIAYGELTLMGIAQAEWVDLFYLASSLAIACAGYLQANAVALPSNEEADALSRWLVVLPYAGLAAGFGVMLAGANGTVSGSEATLLVGAVVLTILVLVRQEITNRENGELRADRVRRDSEAHYRSLEGQATDAVLLVDTDGVVAYASPSLERVLGLQNAALLGTRITRLAHANDAVALEQLIADTAAGRPVDPLEWSLWGADGVWREVETISANLLDDPTVGKIALTTRDVRERKALTQQLTRAGFHDLLTELPNRALFINRVGQALVGGIRSGEPTAILKLDLDGFTRLNDSLGHAIGDLVLQTVAQRVSGCIRAADTAARLSADEFAVLLDGRGTVSDAMEAADRIREALHQPMTLGGASIELTAGIGIATSEEAGDTTDPTVLTRNAHVALAAACQQGPDQVVVFVPSMQQALEDRFGLESDLRRAVTEHQLVLDYQPIVDLATNELVGAEALVRWDHPTRGRIAPDAFIPLAEETGLIGEIGGWVLRTACVDVAAWARCAPRRVPRVSVNLASLQVADPNLPWTVQSALAQAGAAPGWLTLELTERQLVLDTAEVLARLHAIRALGVQIAIDDFGTGYSSLAYLQQFPINTIKIDRSFVTPLDDPDQGSGLAAAIVEIGRALGIGTIAEGIETERQRERLLAMGCPLGQGYLLGRPLDSASMLELVAASALPVERAA